MDFFIFWPSKIHVTPTGIIFSLFPPQCFLSSGRHHHTIASCRTSFPLSQDGFAVFASSFSNVSSHRLPSRAKTKALNMHHHNRSPSSDRRTPTLHYYKKHHVIGGPPATIVLFHRCPTPIVLPYNDIHVDELANPFSFSELFVDM
jgi:hypothetical protein